MYKGFEILPCSISYRGNPSIECGDIISVQDKDLNYYNVLVLNNTVTVTGGLSAKIDCSLKTDIKQDFISIPTSKRIEYKVDGFISAYQKVINELKGVNGGYVQQVKDDNNVVRALAITQSNIQLKWDDDNGKVVAANSSDKYTPMWVWSYGGLSFSPNGGNTYSAAINMKGQIYAEMIVGKLSKFVELQAESGTIGGWTIDESSMYSDYTDSKGNTYRAYIQNASVAGSNSWVFSVQKKTGDDSYDGQFIVQADGSVSAYNGIVANIVNGTTIKGTTINGKVIKAGASQTLELGRSSWTIGDSEADRDYIESSGGFVLCANSGNNAMYLIASSIRLNNNTIINGNLTTKGDITATGGVCLRSSEDYCHLFYSDGYIVLGGGNHAIQLNSGDYAIHFYAGTSIQCHADLMLNFKTISGTAALYVNNKGIVTTSTSSERYKENITEELSEELNPEKLYDLPVKQYNYKEEYKDNELVEGIQIGITAEDVEKYYPNALIRNADGQAESWQDRIMIPAMLKLIQEQKREIDSLKSEQEQINKHLFALEKKITNVSKE